MSLSALTACGGEEDRPSINVGTGPRRPQGSVQWQTCGDDIQCGSVVVPIDYAAPESGTISIAINRVLATGEQYRGVVLVNPGGPGLPGKSFVATSAHNLRALLPGFDFVGFDPRGVGESAPLKCPSASLGALDDPSTILKASGTAGWIDTLRTVSHACAQQNGALFNHVGSNQVVADIDRIRQALGSDQINFLGVSYGTRLGELYAKAFPASTRAVILDGLMAPIADVTELVSVQFDALLQAQANFYADCASMKLTCPADPRSAFDAVLAAQPTDADRDAFLSSWKILMSTPPGRQSLAALLVSAASGQMTNARDMSSMPGGNALIALNLVENLTTTCADNVVAPPTASEADALMASFRARSQPFADLGIPALMCSGWDVKSDPAPEAAFSLQVPPLVIGGTQDILTPLAWAQKTVQGIPGANFLVSEHYGHGATLYGSRCVFSHVQGYLEDLTPVPAGTRCPAP